MDISENLQKWSKIIKNNINEHISAQKNIKPPLLPVFISSVIQFDKFFRPVVLYENYLMVLYENYLICIFMSINEILKWWKKKHG